MVQRLLQWLNAAGLLVASAVLGGLPMPVAAQVIRIANVLEMTGPGATVGVSFRNGLELAVKEINAAGGILGQRIETQTLDIQSNPVLAVSQMRKAVDSGVFAVFGPVYSGLTLQAMGESRRAEVPTFTGGEAAAITEQGNPYIFRTSFTQAIAMPKVAYYISERAGIQTLAILHVNSDFGRGGLAMLRSALAGSTTRISAAISVESGQIDFAVPVQAALRSGADAIFVYTTEDEAVRILVELRKQGWTKPVIGETTLANQKVIDQAGPAADGVIVHVGLTADAAIPEIRAFRANYEREYKSTPDHNSMKGYSGMYVLKAATERAKQVDRKLVARTLKGLKVSAYRYPGALLYTEFNQKGDLDRISFLVEVRNGRQNVLEMLPPLASMQRPGAAAGKVPPAPTVQAATAPAAAASRKH